MKEKLRQGKKIAEKHLDKKLRRRMIMYFCISVIILWVVMYEIAIESINWRMAILFIILGFGIWIGTYRMFHIYRHEDEAKVMSRVDRTGAIILVAYILFSIFRQKIIGIFFQWPMVLAVTMSAVFGMMSGRVRGMKRKIKKILKLQGIL